MRSLSKEDAEMLEEPFTEEEVERSIGRQKNGRSPGASGLPYEFWKTFKDEFTPHLTELFNANWDEERSTTHDLLSLIRLIYKLGKPGANPSNLMYQRPVSLKESYVKIKTSCIVKRLNKVLRHVIPPSQAGFIPGRISADSAVHLHFLIDYFRRNPDEEVLFLSLDQEKAYDKVDHGWILECCAAIGCGPRFLSLMRTLLATGEANARVILNGFLTKPVLLHQGVGQGDGLSCPTYLISFQPFIDALSLRAISSILVKSPFSLPRISTLTTLSFADEVLTTITNPAAHGLLVTLAADWLSASGGSLMVDKSRQLHMNPKPNSRLLFPNVKEWKRDEIWIWVGFPFSAEGDVHHYWEARLVSLIKSLNYGNAFHLSLRSRVQYTNTRVYARFHHVLDAFAPPDTFFKTLESKAVDFIWGKKKGKKKVHRVSRKKVCDPRASGGLALVGLQELNRTARLKFWDWYAEGDRIWVGLARHSLAHHASSLDNHSHSFSPFTLICFPLSITEPFWLSSLKTLKASPPPISPSITLPQLLSLPPTYPKLLHIPSTLATSTKAFLKLPSLATLFHLQPATNLTYSTFSTPANSTNSPSPMLGLKVEPAERKRSRSAQPNDSLV
ncbi:hypothetical protein P7C70_g7889, partial [Phenoliferia sp. Uapishka_3]